MEHGQQADSAEQQRLKRLDHYKIARTAPEPAFDNIVKLAAGQLDVPIAYFCLAEESTHWFKAKHGIDLDEAPRANSFCDHTLRSKGHIIVPDATIDDRFGNFHLVKGVDNIRFYAGVALRDAEGFALGTLAVADTLPRRISIQQEMLLKGLGDLILDRMELRRIKHEAQETASGSENLSEIAYVSSHDHLTSLPNRRLFIEQLTASFTTSESDDKYKAVLLVDIDNFKEVNDTLGHYVGDNLIIAVAKRLEECVGSRGTVARLGGDEFAVLLPTFTDPDLPRKIGIKLIDAFTTPLRLRDHEILVGVSVGIGLGTNQTVDASTLLKNADLALYEAKSDGRGKWKVFEPRMAFQLIQRREIEQDLRVALSNNQFAIHYQPVTELTYGKIIGFEALLRWNHPVKGLIPPAVFIPIAESTGMILQIGTWVLEQACLMAAIWKDDISVSVNVSAVQIKSGLLVGAVDQALKKSRLSAHRLELEITESCLLENSAQTLHILGGLKGLGVSISLDDFGTGYSGLNSLSRFPFDKIKIDRSFVMDIGVRKKSEELVRAIVNIGHSLQMSTLAEGIETAEQLRFLRSLGCEQGQGYLFSQAVPAEEIDASLKYHDTYSQLRYSA